MNKILLLLASLALFMTACASKSTNENLSDAVDTGDNQEFTENQDREHSADDLICRTEQMSGSHFRRRVCRTRDEIEQQRRESQDFLGDRSVPISDSE